MCGNIHNSNWYTSSVLTSRNIVTAFATVVITTTLLLIVGSTMSIDIPVQNMSSDLHSLRTADFTTIMGSALGFGTLYVLIPAYATIGIKKLVLRLRKITTHNST